MNWVLLVQLVITYRFEITVNDPFAMEDLQTLEQGIAKPSYQRDAESLEVVLLDQLIQVHSFKKYNDHK